MHKPHDTPENLDDIHPVSKKFLWLANPKVKRNFIWFTVACLILTVIIGYFFPAKHPAPWEGGLLYAISFGVIGFVAYSIVVFSAWPLFRALSRPEDYYGEDDDDTLSGEDDV
ncbi:hypothetical protein [Robiginitomaculum antarcticum]|uniref:hypothetical protein n=1 Tax=Robiginitomaculum antarcticum TaxID=437507 RepID=UPI00035EF4E5|nr:hypothetical protein [Robiginitomaculum antarcticum]